MEREEPRGWHERGYLPHFDGGPILQSVTYSLADAYPRKMLDAWRRELQQLERKEAGQEERRRIMKYLDAGHGSCLLERPEIAKIVQDTFLHDEGKRCAWRSWVVMPNHVHLLFRPHEGVSLSQLIKDWKSISTRKINSLLGRHGGLWSEDYFDRFIRDEEHYWNMVNYIHTNPVRARLCTDARDFRWSSAYKDR
jgi:REP element-mobilizing transposase RayT